MAQSVSHVMLDHMSSTGVMRGDSRRRGEETVKHEEKKENIAAVQVWYRNRKTRYEARSCYLQRQLRPRASQRMTLSHFSSSSLADVAPPHPYLGL